MNCSKTECHSKKSSKSPHGGPSQKGILRQILCKKHM